MIPKLRAWSKEDKEFLPENDINFVIHPYEETVYHAGTSCNCCDEWVWGCDEEETEDIKVVRYAEFEDRKGIPIYENYLLLCTYGLSGESQIGIVKMQDGCWCVDFSYLPAHMRPCDPSYKCRRDSDYLKMFSSTLGNSMEIVGNVFENPELIDFT